MWPVNKLRRGEEGGNENRRTEQAPHGLFS